MIRDAAIVGVAASSAAIKNTCELITKADMETVTMFVDAVCRI